MVGKLDLYRVFNVVSQNKSFSTAAEELYMTQSAVSQAILKLEKELEVKLFHRTPKGIVMTNEGKVLNDHVNSALGLIHAAEDKISDFKMLKYGELRIGVGDTISRYFLLPYLGDFHAKYPRIKLKILNGTTSEILTFIKSGAADVGICNLPIVDEQLQVTPCKEIHDVFVCGEKYKHIARDTIRFEQLMELPLIFLEKKSNSRLYVERFLNEKGYEVSPAFELGSYDLVSDFARMNLGISCVIREFSEEHLKSGALYEVLLEDEIPGRNIGIVHLKSVPLSRAAEEFVGSIEQRK
ncbi:LysR family transcriptional regulator [Oceanobacillus halophilus]|uniref:LysR family transcriptional regulator n=1 Tax=Oceanobacillus halophilus TaxID=930130 RepID=A0A495A1X0_9BACI|nr:LysR family transcriptional regulator [Oceanobacillus halophilus]RKQ32929.1 LysR family transcriptional regulator [Oceanobacillus halophilus]